MRGRVGENPGYGDPVTRRGSLGAWEKIQDTETRGIADLATERLGEKIKSKADLPQGTQGDAETRGIADLATERLGEKIKSKADLPQGNAEKFFGHWTLGFGLKFHEDP